MFDKEKYISKRISNELPQELILILWNLIEEARPHTQIDYLQIFHLSRVTLDGVPVQKVTHLQENPKYKNEIYIFCNDVITNKLYCIDDESHSTMLFANEY